MANVYDAIDERLERWIYAQPLFFVGTAPLSAAGHVNVSPKGPIDSLRVVDPQTVAYLDIVGSGAETIAHLRENGRIVIMLCAFDGPPRIVRLHGRGEVIQAGEQRFKALMEQVGPFGGSQIEAAMRAIVLVALDRIADSCGYSVPLMSYEGERPHQAAWTQKKLRVAGPQGLIDYQREKNAESIDGLPALKL